MKNISNGFSKNVGRVMLIFLLLLSILNIVLPKYVVMINGVSIAILLVSLYFMTIRVKQITVKEKIATSILKMSELILQVDSKSSFYNSVLKEILKNISGADRGSLITVDEFGDLTFEAVIGFDLEAAQKLNLKFEDTYLFKAIDNKMPKSIVIKDIGLKNKNYFDEQNIINMGDVGIDEIKATVCVPITFDKKLFGLINIDSVTESDFKQEEVELIEYMSVEISKFIRLYRFSENNTVQTKYDFLTGIYNRKAFKTELENFVLKHTTHNRRIMVSLDLNQLKKINETYGYDIGDQYIQYFVKGISKHIFVKEIFSRFDSHHFMLLFLRPIDTLKPFLLQCDTWFQSNPLMVNGENIIVSFSSRSYMFCDDDHSLDNVFIKAQQSKTIDIK